MGGSGSGRFGRRSRRLRVEDCTTLRAGSLLSRLRPGSEGSLHIATWRAEFSVSATVAGVRLHISYPGASGSVVDVVDVVDASHSPQPFGGRRWWWRCPRCARRCLNLHRPPRDGYRFGCRHCYGLTYQSQSRAEARRLELRAHKLFRRAGTTRFADYHYKPARMRWATFDRLIDQAEAYEHAVLDLTLLPFMRRIGVILPGLS